MRTIYLIRHGKPAFPGDERLCISSTDLPLAPEGKEQGERLRARFEGISLQGVYSSDLLRAKETAAFLSTSVINLPEFREIGVGAWEGLAFREIRQRFPEEYALRGQDPIRYGIPGGELPEACRDRGLAALNRLLETTDGDIAVVAHAGINRLILCELLGRDLREFLEIPQPYGCINILHEEQGRLSVQTVAE